MPSVYRKAAEEILAVAAQEARAVARAEAASVLSRRLRYEKQVDVLSDLARTGVRLTPAEIDETARLSCSEFDRECGRIRKSYARDIDRPKMVVTQQPTRAEHGAAIALMTRSGGWLAYDEALAAVRKPTRHAYSKQPATLPAPTRCHISPAEVALGADLAGKVGCSKAEAIRHVASVTEECARRETAGGRQVTIGQAVEAAKPIIARGVTIGKQLAIDLGPALAQACNGA